jgi:hypothetical protein
MSAKRALILAIKASSVVLKLRFALETSIFDNWHD